MNYYYTVHCNFFFFKYYNEFENGYYFILMRSLSITNHLHCSRYSNSVSLFMYIVDPF